MAQVVLKYDDVKTHSPFNNFPECCPHCHKTISPIYCFHRDLDGYMGDWTKATIELFMICPNSSCGRGFLLQFANHRARENGYPYEFVEVVKGSAQLVIISDLIKDISPSFITIYSEANEAEANGLINICGVGYRKALEYLIKDFLIQGDPDNEELIKKKFLGKCIKDHIDNTKLQKAAERAVWLGNDETHYTRKWIDKDLSDLKILIKLTLHWIEMEKLTESLDEDMPK